MKILVTGGAGFIGSHVVDAYLRDGHEVAVLDNLETGSLSNLPEEVSFWDADIRNEEQVRAILQEVRPDVVNHHAAQISVPHSVENPAYDADVNIAGSLRVWKAARDCGVQRFIFASSGGAVYGDNPALPLSEREVPTPTSPYGLSKQVFEMYLAQLRNFGGPVPVVLRYANVYGPRQGARGEGGVISIFVRRGLEGADSTIYGDGGATRDYVYVGDVAEANRLALYGGDGGTFNIASSQQTSTYELFQLVQSLIGHENKEPLFAPERPGDIRYSCLDASLARSELGWTPQHSLEAGLRLTIESMREVCSPRH